MPELQYVSEVRYAVDAKQRTGELLAKFLNVTKRFFNVIFREDDLCFLLTESNLKHEVPELITLEQCRRYYNRLDYVIADKNVQNIYYSKIRDTLNDLLIIATINNSKGEIEWTFDELGTLTFIIKDNKYEYSIFDEVNALEMKYETDSEAIFTLLYKDAEAKIQNLAHSFDLLLNTNSAEYKKYKRKSVIARKIHKFVFFAPVIALVIALVIAMIITFIVVI
mgnify:CR=1 FL=1